MFRVKICGVTSADDARMVIDAGADAVGLNFYANSPRYVSTDRAREISAAVGSAVQLVGIFVNETASRIHELVGEVDLDWVQLHGDEPPEDLARISAAVKVIRVCRLGAGALQAIADDLDSCRSAGREPTALLVDAVRPGAYGGTGEKLDWQALVDYRRQLGDTPLILAGGLTSSNVVAATQLVRPDAVDVASGVESKPGVKDSDLVRSFIQAALDGLRA